MTKQSYDIFYSLIFTNISKRCAIIYAITLLQSMQQIQFILDDFSYQLL